MDENAECRRAIELQSRVCAERTRAIELELQRLSQETRDQDKAIAALGVELATLKTAQAVQSVRFGLAAAIGAAVPTIALGIIFLLSK